MTDIAITDADYQALERHLALENLGLRREAAVYARRILELEREIAALRARVADLTPADESDEAPVTLARRGKP